LLKWLNRQTHFWKRTIQWLFHQNFVLIEQMVSDNKIFMGISYVKLSSAVAAILVGVLKCWTQRRRLQLLIFFTEVIKFYWLMLLLYPGELYRLLGASSYTNQECIETLKISSEIVKLATYIVLARRPYNRWTGELFIPSDVIPHDSNARNR
jgi:hypothetical protein